MEVSKFFGEKRISIAQAGRLIASLRGGGRPATATTYRWCQKGLRNVRLEHAWVGGKIVTSEEAVKRFISATDRSRNQSEQTIVGCEPSQIPVDPEQVAAATGRVAEFLRGKKGAGRASPPASPANPQTENVGVYGSRVV